MPRPALAGLQLDARGPRSRASSRARPWCSTTSSRGAPSGPSRRRDRRSATSRRARFGGRFDLHVAFFDGPYEALRRGRRFRRARARTSGADDVGVGRRAEAAAGGAAAAARKWRAFDGVGSRRRLARTRARVRARGETTPGPRRVDGAAVTLVSQAPCEGAPGRGRRATRFANAGARTSTAGYQTARAAFPVHNSTHRDAEASSACWSRLSFVLRPPWTLSGHSTRSGSKYAYGLPGRGSKGSDVPSSDTSSILVREPRRRCSELFLVPYTHARAAKSPAQPFVESI